MQYKEILDAEFGSRHPSKKIYKFITLVAFFWSLFQLWVASPLQYSDFFGHAWFLFNNVEIRSIHLSIGVFLTFLLFPVFKGKHTNKIPFFDYCFAVIGSCASLYIFLFYQDLTMRIGMPTDYDLVVAIVGVALLFEASRRVIGPTVAIIASFLLLYSFFGQHFPGILAHRGNSISSIASHQWFSSEGVFGTALGVSADFVFLYVLFGAFLEKAGAGNFFIQLSFALLGRFTGGPAKAAVVASGLMGMISGSSIANTITVGSFTIPLMKKMGLSPEKAGAIEVSAGINGQVMPPVMGAAAFIMSEYLAMPYTEIIRHAFLPAVLIYIALLYTVHIEAKKMGIKPLKSSRKSTGIFYSLLRGGIISSFMFIIFGLIHLILQGFGSFSGLSVILADNTIYVVTMVLLLVYVLTLKYQSKFDDLHEQGEEPILELPDISKILKTGLHFFIPLVILVWSLMVSRLSPSLSAYWAIIFLIVILITQNAIKSFFREQESKVVSDLKQGVRDVITAMILGARNMVPIAIATATAGVIVGTISLTGVGLRLGNIIDVLASGNVLFTLLLTALVCIVLGIGMPTTACYIIVSTLMVPVLEYVFHKNGIFVPTFALHLFVFYFGLMADVTPPVGLAAYAAAAVAKGNTLKTGGHAFLYNMRTMTLPFIFVFNPQILLYGITSVTDFVILLVSSVIGIFMISAATQGYFLIKSKLHESLALLVIGISLLYPQGWINVFSVQFSNIDLNNIKHELPEGRGDKLKVLLIDPLQSDKGSRAVVLFDALSGASAEEKLYNAGISDLSFDHDGNLTIGSIGFSSKAAKADITAKHIIDAIEISNIQPNKNLVLLPTIFILGVIIFVQRARIRSC